MRIQALMTATVLALTATACSPAEDKAPAPAHHGDRPRRSQAQKAKQPPISANAARA